ncbi:hypothetical protein, partial [Cellulomonas triticagri]|uniref:hypothetical protein n=1 Tax=Cellulomonas triticagri TaxID=2483352 RepID=UPI0018F70312
AALAAGAALAVAGLVTLVVVWAGLVTATLREGLDDDAAGGAGTCVAAAADGEGDAVLGSTIAPPEATCRWTVDGREEVVVLARGSQALVTGAAVAVGAGLLVVGGTSVVAARARRSARER